MGKVITYECDECGCEVVVTETPETQLSPIYCCGAELYGASSSKKSSKPVKKAVKKVVKKKVATKPVKKKAQKK